MDFDSYDAQMDGSRKDGNPLFAAQSRRAGLDA